MHRTNGRVSMLFAAMGVLCGFMQSSGCAAYTFNDITNQHVTAGFGSFEYKVKMTKDISKDPQSHVMLFAVSSDLREFYMIELLEKNIIVWRDFAACMRTAFCSPYEFNVGDCHDLKLSWNGASTKFCINGNEMKKLKLFARQDVTNTLMQIRLARDEAFVISNFVASAQSDVQVDPADQEIVAKARPPNLHELAVETPQEQSRGVALRHFPDQKSRDTAKAYLALMPDGFVAAVKSVVYVEDARFPKGGEAGLADCETGNVFLKGSYFDDPTCFFHEAAHLYDTRLAINVGVMNDKSEWAAISGSSCYYGGGDVEGFSKNFGKIKTTNAFLGVQGGQCPSEDLAIWVGAVYDYYLKKKSFYEMLDPASPKYSEKSRKKLYFILRKGFISKELYDKVTAKAP